METQQRVCVYMSVVILTITTLMFIICHFHTLDVTHRRMQLNVCLSV